MLSRVHGEFIWLDRPHKITKEPIRAITSLPQVGQKPEKKTSNDQINKLTSATSDSRSMRVITITDKDVKFINMIIGYKVNQFNQLNFVSSSYIVVAYQMLKKDEKYDLCEWMKEELIINLGKIKGEKKGVF